MRPAPPLVRLGLTFACALAAAAALAGAAPRAQTGEAAPDPIEALQQKLARGEVSLAHRAGGWGYLPSVLEALDIPLESQVLVFSKTSLQFLKIAPRTPRAIYFNDDTAVGAVQGGGVIEVTTTGADGRIAFYGLPAAPADQPRFSRESTACLGCHSSAGGLAPGMIVANIVPRPDGSPLFVQPDRMFDLTDSRTPFERRWGGWYVTGEAGRMRHNGNVYLEREGSPELDPTAGLNVTDLSSRFDVGRYLAPTSDIVALMTLEHQIGAMNRMWSLQGGASDVEDLVAYLLGVGEAALPSPVRGNSRFAEGFAARGPFDARGRSLREFDLRTRLFRYPVSYMVYSRAFDAIRPVVRDRIYRRMFDILSGADTSAKYAGLSPDRRRAALEILVATKPDLPAYWRAAAPGVAQAGDSPQASAPRT